MKFQKGNTHGRFTKGESGNPNGRPKKSALMEGVRKLGKYAPITEQDIKEGYQWLLGQPIEVLKDVVRNTEDYPSFLSIAAKELLGKFGFSAVEGMNNRVYGRPKQQSDVDVTTNGKNIVNEPCVFEIIDRREQVEKKDVLGI